MRRFIPIFFLLFLIFTIVPVHADHFMFRSGFQGLEVTFEAVRWNGYTYTESNIGPNPNYVLSPAEAYDVFFSRGSVFVYEDTIASAHKFHERLNFDPDLATDGLPNLKATCDMVTLDSTIPEESWTIQIEKPVTELIQNASGTFNVTSIHYKEVFMKWVKFTVALNILLEGSHMEAYPDVYSHWTDAEIWLAITVNNFCYIKDAVHNDVDIAVTGITLKEPLQWNNYDVAKYQSVFPGAKGETMDRTKLVTLISCAGIITLFSAYGLLQAIHPFNSEGTVEWLGVTHTLKTT